MQSNAVGGSIFSHEFNDDRLSTTIFTLSPERTSIGSKPWKGHTDTDGIIKGEQMTTASSLSHPLSWCSCRGLNAVDEFDQVPFTVPAPPAYLRPAVKLRVLAARPFSLPPSISALLSASSLRPADPRGEESKDGWLNG